MNWGSSMSGSKCHIIKDRHALCDPKLFMWDNNRQPSEEMKCKKCMKLIE